MLNVIRIIKIGVKCIYNDSDNMYNLGLGFSILFWWDEFVSVVLLSIREGTSNKCQKLILTKLN